MCALSVNWFMYTSHIAADNIAQLNNQYFFFWWHTSFLLSLLPLFGRI